MHYVCSRSKDWKAKEMKSQWEEVNQRAEPEQPISVKGILKLGLTYIFSTRDEGCFFSI
jgi:hypothetical protein